MVSTETVTGPPTRVQEVAAAAAMQTECTTSKTLNATGAVLKGAIVTLLFIEFVDRALSMQPCRVP